MARSLFPLQSFHTHTELTPALWDGDKMKPEVRKQLVKIAKTFEESLGVPVKVRDVWLTGSTANYNWSEFSDIDLHILIDFSEIDEDEEMVRELMLAKKSVFNEEHDIRIGPFEVELYAQDVNEPHEATGVFSVQNDRWVRKPKQENPRLDLVAVKRKAKSMMRMIDNALGKDSCDSACLDRAMDRVKKMRKAGLDKGGEYSVENLAFKVLRRNGYLEKLWTEQRKRLDKELSLPARVATTWLRRFFGGAHVAVSFEEWVQGRRFPNPNPRGRKKEILFKSLPVPEQEKIRARWQQSQRAQPPAQSPRVKDPLFHTTSHASLEEIAEKGLSPRSGGGTFEHGGYGEHSQGKVFLSDNPEAARAWQDKVFQQLEDRHGDSEDLGRRVPVMLRVKDRKTERDPVGDKDVPGSRFTGDTVPPEDIEFWHPKKKRWEPVSTWGQDTGPEHAISEKTKDGIYVNDEAFMPADEDAYSRNDAVIRQQEKAEQQRRRQEVDKERAQEEKKRQEQEKAKWLEPKRRREWIDKIKEKGFKSPIPGASTKPGVFDRMWQDRLKVNEKGKPLPDYPLEVSEKGPALKDTGQETWSGGKIYRADVKDDTFVHFTPRSRAKQILESGKLLADPPYKKFGLEGVQAVSLGYGDYTPEVQTTHTKTDEKDPLVAVVFQTSTSPRRGYIEEVLWDEDVELREPRIISSEKAQELMKKAPQKLSEDDMVLYGEEQQKTKKVARVWLLRRAKYNPEFLQWAEQQRFPSPKTRARIKFVSLPDDEKQKIYERWKSMAQGDQAERVKKENRWLVPNPDPKRFEHVKFQIRLDEETAQEDQKRLQQIFGTEDQNKIRDTILDLAGAGGVASLVTSVDVLTWQEGEYEARVKVMGRGKHGLHFDRTLRYENTGDEDRPFYPLVIENQMFSVGSDAPPGVGTRMLASQVGAAEQEGFHHIEAEASRGGEMNGYYTWPRLGFNAAFTKEDMQDLEDELPEAAWQVQQLAEMDSDRMWDDAPAELFHVMAIPEAREWWEREGHSVMASFSVSEDFDGGKAYQLLRAYTEAKAMAEGKTIPEYLAKIAAKRRNMAPRLTKQDNEILDRVWDQARQKIVADAKAKEKKKKASELARFWVWTKVVERSLEI